jgi:hypothetical protein
MVEKLKQLEDVEEKVHGADPAEIANHLWTLPTVEREDRVRILGH